MSFRLGIDTGGTYTDAVLLEQSSRQVVAKAKSLTTRHNLIEGIAHSIEQVMEGHDPAKVKMVCLSTTLATNSIVEGHGARAALFLVGYQASQLKLANLSDAARDLPVIMLAGGHDAGGHENSHWIWLRRAMRWKSLMARCPRSRCPRCLPFEILSMNFH